MNVGESKLNVFLRHLFQSRVYEMIDFSRGKMQYFSKCIGLVNEKIERFEIYIFSNGSV